MSFDIQESIKLLSPEYFENKFTQNHCQFLTSVFQDEYHNFIVPDIHLSSEDVVRNKELLNESTFEGKSFSYYVPESLNEKVKDPILSAGFKFDNNTRYVFKQISEKYEIPDHKIITLNEDNFGQFLEAALVCFPDWESESFTGWCLDCPAVEMLAVIIEDKMAAFAGYFSKPDNDYVLLMNAGTLPEFRRQGFHDYMIKRRINEILEQKRSAVFYADVDDGEASHLGFQKLSFDDGPIFVMYN